MRERVRSRRSRRKTPTMAATRRLSRTTEPEESRSLDRSERWKGASPAGVGAVYSALAAPKPSTAIWT
jgi:hypothetical protein